MKIVISILLLELFFMNSPIVNAQPNLSDTINYGKRNVVPEWVKKKTTTEQYQIWKTLSGYYHYIDYRTLKRSDLDSCFWDGMYRRMAMICKGLRDGEIAVKENEGFSVTGGGIIRSPYCSEMSECKKQRVIIYSSYDGNDAHVELTFYYLVDQTTGKPCILKCSTRGISFSGLRVKAEQDTSVGESFHTFKLVYLPKDRMFQGYYQGKLYFTDAIGDKHQEEVCENFFVTFDNRFRM